MTIVDEILRALDLIAFQGARVYMHPRWFFKELDKVSRKKYKPSTFYGTLHRLEEKGWVESKGERRQKIIAITPLGRAQLLVSRKKLKKEWDGKWRLVIFDVPEKKRKNRDFFRYQLRAIGLQPIQRSVWVTPFNLLPEVEELVEMCEVKSYVIFATTKEVSNQGKMMKLFGLT